MAGRGKSDSTGEIFDDWWYDVVKRGGTSRVLDHENLQSGRSRVEDVIGEMFVYRHGLGLSEFGETSSFLNHAGQLCPQRTWGLGSTGG